MKGKCAAGVTFGFTVDQDANIALCPKTEVQSHMIGGMCEPEAAEQRTQGLRFLGLTGKLKEGQALGLNSSRQSAAPSRRALALRD